eukprot:3309899-Pleurochrysis_carterae.AAC.2
MHNGRGGVGGRRVGVCVMGSGKGEGKEKLYKGRAGKERGEEGWERESEGGGRGWRRAIERLSE